MHDLDAFVEVVVKATGEKQYVPKHFLENPVLRAPFELPPSARAKADEPLVEPVDQPVVVDEPVEPATTDDTQTPAAAPAAGKNPGRRG